MWESCHVHLPESMSLVLLGSAVGVLWWCTTAFGLGAERGSVLSVESLRDVLDLSEPLLLEYE